MNWRNGTFHGSWWWLSSEPSFFGLSPSSLAIATWHSDPDIATALVKDVLIDAESAPLPGRM